MIAAKKKSTAVKRKVSEMNSAQADKVNYNGHRNLANLALSSVICLSSPWQSTSSSDHS